MRQGILAVGFAVAALGCAAPQPSLMDFSDRPRSFSARDYHRVRGQWTRHQKVMHGLDPALEVWATFKSHEFREAFVERYADLYRLADPERKALHENEREGARTSYEFHVAAQSTNFSWNDLENRNSAWRVFLLDGAGRELAPQKVEAPRIPDVFLAEFFPDRTPFTRTYVFRFAKPSKPSEFVIPGSGRMVLVIAGPVGRAELEWRAK